MSLEFTILGLLNRKPRSGYEISKIVSRTTNFYWTATQTQVYQYLKKMAAKEWVAVNTVLQTNKPSKQIYSITPKGAEKFETWLRNPPAPRTVKNSFLVQMYFLDNLSKDEIIKKIQDVQKMHENRLKEYLEYKKGIINHKKSAKENMARYLPLLAGIIIEEGWIKWCEEALEELNTLSE
ncbi:MAG: PadR family transcriptional regulator [Syntrophomonadaceae bacterium]|nr:PadR family transcriptional regulator [Syntrophomonadaceae bacterium]